MAIPFYVRGNKELKETSNTSAIIAEFEKERDALDAAFTAVSAGVAAAVVPATSDWVTPPVGTVIGESCYDTTLSKPFWWDGSAWNDAAAVAHP